MLQYLVESLWKWSLFGIRIMPLVVNGGHKEILINSSIQKKIDEEAAEAQKKAQEELAKNPPPLPADKQVPDKQMPGPSTQPPTLTSKQI